MENNAEDDRYNKGEETSHNAIINDILKPSRLVIKKPGISNTTK